MASLFYVLRTFECLQRLMGYARFWVFMAAPSKTVTVQQLEKDMEKLGDLYWLGYQDCMDQLTELKRYLIAAC